MSVYFDNAATTPLDPVVLEAMLPYLQDHFGNPSSIHTHGRKVKSAIEQSRKKIADLLNTSPSEIFFTSGGTEADNMAIRGIVEAKAIKHIITSPLEHHAVLHTVEMLEKSESVKVHYLEVDVKGIINLSQLDELLRQYPDSLVTLMHGNNEIGAINELKRIGALCKEYNAIFHSDTVQTMGHYAHNLQELTLDFLVGSAHKFHGPKGVGFIYINHQNKIAPFIQGGSQERNMRGGTENVYGIIGLAKALEVAYQHMTEHRSHIEKVKAHAIKKFSSSIPGISFSGPSGEITNSLYTVLNVSLPPGEHNEMMLFNLDINGISASGGSACSSGSGIGSHVLQAMDIDPMRGAIRFSFSRFNTLEEVDFVVDKVAEMISSSA